MLEVIAKLVRLGISLLRELALRAVLVAKLEIPDMLSSLFFILALYTSFLTTLFLVHHLVYLNQQEQLLISQRLLFFQLIYFIF